MLHEVLLENYLLQIKKIYVFSTLGKFHKFDKSTTQNLSFKNKIKTLSKFEKILKFFNKISQSKNF